MQSIYGRSLLEDSRGQRLVEIKRQMALVRTDVRRLQFIMGSQRHPEDFKRQAQNDLIQAKQMLAGLAQELNSAE